MPRGGAREGAGRKGPTRNKVTVEMRATITETARQYTPQAIQALVDIMSDPAMPPAARATCANSLIDRGWGKAPQHFEHTGKDGVPLFDPSKYSDDELAQLRRLVEKATEPSDHRSGTETTQH